LPKRCKPIRASVFYYFLQAAALALAGRVEEARPIVGQLLELEPTFRSSTILEHGLTRAVVDRLIEGARYSACPNSVDCPPSSDLVGWTMRPGQSRGHFASENKLYRK
jgi:hypothetical protein